MATRHQAHRKVLVRRSWIPLAFGMALLLISCRSGQKADAPAPSRKALTIQVNPASVRGSAVYAGTVAARHISNQGFRVSGVMLERLVEVGQHVTVGQPLLQLDTTNLALTRQQALAQLDAARSQAAQARVNLGRDAALLKQDFISQAAYDRDKVSLDTAVAQLQAAKAQYEQADNEVGYATLRAAVDGLVTSIDVDVGETTSPGKTAVGIARDGDREVVINIPESRVAELRDAEAFEVTLWAVPGQSWSARLREIDPAANKTTGTYDAHVTISHPGRSMLLGMTAYVHVRNPGPGISFEIPLTAVIYPGNGPAVWKVGPDGTLAARSVGLGVVHGDTALITSGLHKGDIIVTQGGSLLHEGEKIDPITASGKEAAP